MLKETKIGNIPWLHIYGRTGSSTEPLPLFLTGSGIEFCARTGEVWLETEAGFQLYEPWICVLLDGAPVLRMPVPQGRVWLQLLHTLDQTSTHTITVLRETQAMNEDPASFLVLHAVRTTGIFCPTQSKKCRIEFIGDSITSGEGTFGAHGEMNWNSMVFSAAAGYPFLLAQKLRADFRVLSASGWGVLSGCDGNPDHALPLWYSQVCGFAGESNQKYGSADPYNFSRWKADAVVINLGTNDVSAFGQAPFACTDGTPAFCQELDSAGNPAEASLQRLTAACVQFLQLVRQKNPSAKILWVYGMLGSRLHEIFEQAVQTAAQIEHDDNFFYISLPDANDGMLGSRGHPGRESHRRTAAVLQDILGPLLFDESDHGLL